MIPKWPQDSGWWTIIIYPYINKYIYNIHTYIIEGKGNRELFVCMPRYHKINQIMRFSSLWVERAFHLASLVPFGHGLQLTNSAATYLLSWLDADKKNWCWYFNRFSAKWKRITKWWWLMLFPLVSRYHFHFPRVLRSSTCTWCTCQSRCLFLDSSISHLESRRIPVELHGVQGCIATT